MTRDRTIVMVAVSAGSLASVLFNVSAGYALGLMAIILFESILLDMLWSVTNE